MAGSVFKKCGCRAPVAGPDGLPVLDAAGRPKLRRLGTACPQLRRGTGWNAKHGTWHFQLEITLATGRCTISHGGLPTRGAAEAQLGGVNALLALADEPGLECEESGRLRAEIVEQIRCALRAGAALPGLEPTRAAVRTGRPATGELTVAGWLGQWLAGKGAIAAGTRRSYAGHIDNYLVPYLGAIRLDRLRVAHVQDMFAAITANNAIIRAANTARRAALAAAKTAWRAGDTAGWRAARAELAAMAPFGKPVEAATCQRIRATLRSALGAAVAQQLIAVNVGALTELPSGRAPKALIWTTARVAYWRQTGTVPSPVMVWTPAQTRAFLTHPAVTGHPGFALFQLIAFTGLRRGEAVGLRWTDVDLDAPAIHIGRQIVQLGWDTAESTPKTEAGDRPIPLAKAVADTLRRHRSAQRKAAIAAGRTWNASGPVFTDTDGTRLHPATATAWFKTLTPTIGLPPIRLHDLRHGAASLALWAGVDIKVVSEMLGHSGTAITRDLYTSVFEQLQHHAAQAIADAITNAPDEPAPQHGDEHDGRRKKNG